MYLWLEVIVALRPGAAPVRLEQQRRAAPIARQGYVQTLQIGSIPKLSRCLSMAKNALASLRISSIRRSSLDRAIGRQVRGPFQPASGHHDCRKAAVGSASQPATRSCGRATGNSIYGEKLADKFKCGEQRNSGFKVACGTGALTP